MDEIEQTDHLRDGLRQAEIEVACVLLGRLCEQMRAVLYGTGFEHAHDPVRRDYPAMPTSQAEWEAHCAFYRLTVAQRDSAWARIRELESKLNLDSGRGDTEPDIQTGLT